MHLKKNQKNKKTFFPQLININLFEACVENKPLAIL
jgi:hypothetical protein